MPECFKIDREGMLPSDHKDLDSEANRAAYAEAEPFLRKLDRDAVCAIVESHARSLANPATGSRADFSFADLEDMRFSVLDLRHADFHGANLAKADLRITSLQCANFHGANLEAVTFSCYLVGAIFRCSNLSEAKLNNARLWGADLSGALCKGAQMRGVDLNYANLEMANFEGADLRGASLEQAHCEGARFARADLRGVSIERAFKVNPSGAKFCLNDLVRLAFLGFPECSIKEAEDIMLMTGSE